MTLYYRSTKWYPIRHYSNIVLSHHFKTIAQSAVFLYLVGAVTAGPTAFIESTMWMEKVKQRCFNGILFLWVFSLWRQSDSTNNSLNLPTVIQCNLQLNGKERVQMLNLPFAHIHIFLVFSCWLTCHSYLDILSLGNPMFWILWIAICKNNNNTNEICISFNKRCIS